jgi:dTDP-4-amino-4,6-dideoxygalactose transaminase
MNGKIQEFNSILAYHAINHFEKTKKRRADIMEMYRDDLFDSPVRVWETRPSVDATYKDCVIFTQSPAERNRLETYLNEKGIGTKRYFDPAIPDMGSFNGIVHSADNGRRLANICLTLPLYPSLTNKEVAYVTSSIDNFFKRG